MLDLIMSESLKIINKVKFSNKVNPLNLVLPENTLQNTSDWMNSSVEKTLDYIQTNTRMLSYSISRDKNCGGCGGGGGE